MKHAFLTLLVLFVCLEARAFDFTSTKGGSHCESTVNGIKTCTVNWAHDVDHGSHNFSITDTDFGTTYYFKNKNGNAISGCASATNKGKTSFFGDWTPDCD